jgi:NAD(P)H-hydrate epimerase
VDQVAIEELGVPGVVLMENAGLGLTEVVEGELQRLAAPPDAAVGVVCGRGNNGGDGFVLARHLALRGYRPRLVYTGELAAARRDGDAGVNLTIAEKAGLPLEEAGDGEALRAVLTRWAADGVLLLADAVFGTGLAGALREPGLGIVTALAASTLPVVAVDIPSGLDADTGQPLGAAVEAAATATFVARKVGFDQPGAAAYTGAVTVVPIGCPAQAWGFVAG